VVARGVTGVSSCCWWHCLASCRIAACLTALLVSFTSFGVAVWSVGVRVASTLELRHGVRVPAVTKVSFLLVALYCCCHIAACLTARLVSFPTLFGVAVDCTGGAPTAELVVGLSAGSFVWLLGV
jgi:hypothetical protein